MLSGPPCAVTLPTSLQSTTLSAELVAANAHVHAIWIKPEESNYRCARVVNDMGKNIIQFSSCLNSQKEQSETSL